MRRTYISPEFDYSNVYGTFNMKEEATLFGSKMLEVEDEFTIDNQSLVYYQALNKEQIDLSIESSLPPISYSSSEDKRINHTLVIDNSQPNSQKETTTRYVLTIDLKTILTNFIFATLKTYRTFEGVKNIMTKNKDVNYAITEYIVKNVLDRYKVDKIELFLNYVDIQGRSVLRYNNVWGGYTDVETNRTAISPDIIGVEKYQQKKIQTQTEFDESRTIVTFNQDEKSDKYCFDYYYKLYYKKI